MQSNTEPKCKGNTVLQVKMALRKDFGEDRLEEILARCAPETRAQIGGVVLSNGYYPESAFADLAQACFDALGEETARRYARTLARRQVNTFFQVLLRLFVSPRRFSENNHKLWHALHDTGELSVEHGQDDRSHIVSITGFDFCTPAYEQLFVEYHCAVLELTGARNVRGSSRKVAPDSYQMSFTWE